MTNMDSMADIHNPAAGSWYQPIPITTRVAPRVYTTRQVRSMSGLGTESSPFGQGVILIAGLALLGGLAWVALKG